MSFGLLDWLEEPPAGHGVAFLDDDDRWIRKSYPELARSIRSTAAQLIDRGVEPGDVVAIVMPNCADFVHAFYGALLAGATPAPIGPPTPLDAPDKYADHVASMLQNLRPRIVTTPELLPIVSKAAERSETGRTPAVLDGEYGGEDFDPVKRGQYALIQFSSGTTGTPRATQLSWDNVEANMEASSDRFGFAQQGCAFWLPFYHDMGLIGGLLLALTHGGDLSFMTPEQFIRSPLRWLEDLGTRSEPAYSGSTSFGLAYTLKRVASNELEDLDFSNWGALVVGAERLDPNVLSRFARWLEPHGFDPAALRPAYGLGEATLAVTGRQSGSPLRAVRPRWDTVAYGGEVALEDTVTLPDPDAVGDGTGWVTSCGAPIFHSKLAIENERGEALPDLALGEIVVGGRCVAAGYTDRSRPGGVEFGADGRIRTGDAGFTLDGELYVLGRMGDALKVRGRHVFAEDLEARMSTLPGIKKGRCVVLPSQNESGEEVVAIVEAARDGWHEPTARLLRQELGEIRIRVYAVPHGSIPKTSSGKPRRRMLWTQMLEGEVAGELVFDSESTATGRARSAGRA